MEVVASLSQVRTAAAQCGLFTYKSVPVIFEPPCMKVDRRTVRILDVIRTLCVEPMENARARKHTHTHARTHKHTFLTKLLPF